MFGCSENSAIPIHPNILRNSENSAVLAVLAIPTKTWNSKLLSQMFNSYSCYSKCSIQTTFRIVAILTILNLLFSTVAILSIL